MFNDFRTLTLPKSIASSRMETLAMNYPLTAPAVMPRTNQRPEPK
jgi:hypothetical protein